jgi:hypothetical protein
VTISGNQDFVLQKEMVVTLPIGFRREGTTTHHRIRVAMQRTPGRSGKPDGMLARAEGDTSRPGK